MLNFIFSEDRIGKGVSEHKNKMFGILKISFTTIRSIQRKFK